MKNRVRVTSYENGLITNAKIEVRGPDGEWVDISSCVKGATVHLNVGEVSRVNLRTVLADISVEALKLDDAALAAFAHALSDAGWTVEPPSAD